MTGGDSILATERKRRRWQFSLGGLMVFVTGVAVGLSMASMQTLDWTHGILGAVVAWIVVGLAVQVRDLWGTFHGQRDLCGDERFGWRFAVFWRVVVVCLLAGYYLLAALRHLKVIALPEPNGIFGLVGANLRDGILLVCLITVVSSVLPARQTERRGRRYVLLNLAGAAAGVVVCAIVCWDRTCIQFLVAIAIQGIETAQPLDMAPEGVEILPAVRTARFFRESSLAALLGLVNLGLTYGLATQWFRGRWRRLAWAGLLVVAMPISVGYLAWVFFVALPRAFPIMIVAQQFEGLHIWTSAVLVVLFMVSAAAYRLSRLPSEPCGRADHDWRRAEGRYYHERRAVIFLLIFGVGAQAVAMFSFWVHFSEFGRPLPWLEILELFVCEGPFLLRFALLLLAGYALFMPARREPDRGPLGPPRLPAARFASVWLAMFVTAATGIPMLALFSFALWFSPWCAMPWP